MNTHVYEKLKELKIWKNISKYEAKYVGIGIDGIPTQPVKGLFELKSFDEKTGKFTGEHLTDLKTITVPYQDVVALDGMDPKSFVAAFMDLDDHELTEDCVVTKKIKYDEFGNPVRRGRKPNALKKKIAEMEKQKVEQ